MKKITSILLSLVMIFGFIAFIPFEANADAVGDMNAELYNAICNAVENVEDTLDISSFKVKIRKEGEYSDYEEINTLIQHIQDDRPEFFYFDSCYMSADGTYLTKLNFYYWKEFEFYDGVKTLTKKDIKAMKNELDTFLDSILEDIPYLDTMSDLGKITSVHDYIASNYAYDYEGVELEKMSLGEYSYANYDVYSMMYYNSGVCQAFSGMFTLLMRKLGIDVSYSSSNSMNHIWNLVKLDGEWYHIDVTWDDYSLVNNDCFGLVGHDNFLQSGYQFTENPETAFHGGNVEYFDCDSTKYDNAFWTDIISSIVYVNDSDCYYVMMNGSNKPTLVHRNGDNVNTVFTMGSHWGYTVAFSGVDVFDGYIYFNSKDTIYRYKPEGEVEVYKAFNSLGGVLMGLTIVGDELTCGISSNVIEGPDEGENGYVTLKLPKEEPVIKPEVTPESFADSNSLVIFENNGNKYIKGFALDSLVQNFIDEDVSVCKKDGTPVTSGVFATGYTITIGEETLTVIIKGDIDERGKITAKDYIDMRLYILGVDRFEGARFIAADINNSGTLTVTDYIELRKAMLGISQINQLN